jgi:8-oxo-dGTP pyrophosphatase MutT (NUDIX family)
MSFLDRINECNAHDLAHFVPFTVAGARVGWVKPAFAARLRAFPAVFSVSNRAVAITPALADYRSRTDAVDGVLRELARERVIAGWRDECYAVGTSFHGPHAFAMERAAVPLFGVRAYGVHVNGFVRDKDGLRMWVGRRAKEKHTYPGQLDNLIAGGQPVGIGLFDNLIKEAAEEASVPRALAETARPAGVISYVLETDDGLRPDTMFVYDLELPADFTPRSNDGEVEEFYLWPMDKVMDVVANTTKFKFNCNLVVIDFCVRHGLIGPDEPDYVEIVRGLRRQA